MSIIVKDLVKAYGTQKAVDHISFEVQPGEILGFLGPNGAGKSTTMKIATGYIPSTSGTVLVDGFDVTEQSLEVRKIVGYLPEHNPLYLDMYVHEYLRFIGKVHKIPSVKLKPRIKEIIQMAGLEVEQNKQIGSLSKGYRQRVGLAQALLHDPKVLILDEPTTGLDPNQIVEIRNLIKQISQEKTVVFSTHIMQEVQAICDRAIIINRGSIVADQSVESLKAGAADRITLLVEWAGEIDESMLQSLEGVDQLENLHTGKWKISGSKTSDLRKKLVNLSAAQNWDLMGLTVEEHSLENVFRELTATKD
ncbi:MAG: gliding motility-associated ABC transporter ATP-binding subunit GldA [Cyclobacteriaceae bacterium]